MQKIFLVEDSPLVLSRLAALLGALPGTTIVGTAAGADEAVQAILEIKPDVVFLDLKLTQGTGFDVLLALHGKAPGMRLYMLTNFCSNAYRQQATRLGACGFYDKTNEFERVRDVIANHAGAVH